MPLIWLTVAAACSASTASISSDVDADSQPSSTDEPIFAAEPTATATATPEAIVTPEPTATATPEAIATPEPTATDTPEAAATSDPVPVGMSPTEFELLWDILAPSAAELIPEVQQPLVLSDPSSGVYAELELTSYKLSDGVLLATSLTDGWIDGYVLFFDPNSLEAIQALLLVSFSLGEAVISDAVLDAVYQGEPSQPSDVPITFDGVDHQIEALRTGADPVNDPLWVLTAVPSGSTVDPYRLRLAGAEAARATF